MENNQLQSFGPLQKLIEDDSIEEIWINTPNRVFVARGGKSELTNLVLTKDIVHDLIERLLIWGGRRLDVSNPFVDARLPDGSRLHVAIPEVTATHWAVNVRKHLNYLNSLTELLEIGSINEEILEILVSAINRSSASASLTSPTIIRLGRMRRDSLINLRREISPSPSKFAFLVCSAIQSGKFGFNSKTSSIVMTRSLGDICETKAFKNVVFPA